MMTTNRSRTRRVLAGLALAAGATAAYGITATGADLIPTNEDEPAAGDTQHEGVHIAAIDLTPAFAPDTPR